ncbi:MAG: ATP-binding cassette domain-containing protein, partial [Spirochaetota bacterium]|nr:ATP-binding cassette domain-containing protein [Spirochaetota bacterium]
MESGLEKSAGMKGGEKPYRTGSPLVSMRGITKVFPENGVTANRSVDFDLEHGEIHALVGENGSGKSTLMHVLSGLLQPDGGSIEVRGVHQRFRTPREALSAGIGMVHQHLQIVREFTVLENIIMGREPRTAWGLVDWSRAERKTCDLMDLYGLNMDPRQPAYSLSIDGMQKTALLSLLFAGADVVILDEPMTLFDEKNQDALRTTLIRLIEEGHSLILITHKLKEALAYSDRISIMRSGRRVGTFRSSELSRDSLSELMVSGEPGRQAAGGAAAKSAAKSAARSAAPDLRVAAAASATAAAVPTDTAPGAPAAGPAVPGDSGGPGEVLLELRKIGYTGAHLPALKDMSFRLSRGEIVAVTGIRENGLETLEQILAGFTIPTSGSIYYKQVPITGASIQELRRRRIAYIPTERLVRGASMDSSVAENMIILNYRDFHSWGVMKREEIEHFSGALGQQYNIKASPEDKLSRLSGGNIQKVIISRELHTRPDLVIFSEPSWGLDLAGRQFVLEKIRAIKLEGSAILVITSD